MVHEPFEQGAEVNDVLIGPTVYCVTDADPLPRPDLFERRMSICSEQETLHADVIGVRLLVLPRRVVLVKNRPPPLDGWVTHAPLDEFVDTFAELRDGKRITSLIDL
ncbi:hypothetical protein [Rhodococcoides corynebacterioides]|uniref:hypothetical protein n=1 Tax=Rhodococcoides corynebacterioides TaxID=53972 RepID=UPI000B2EB86F|nr:hypothetical protein [Rhodococcus corynebacterioides]